MELRNIIASIDDSSCHLCIVAKQPWSGSAEAKLVALTPDFGVPRADLEQGYEYFPEVSVALEEVIRGPGVLLTDEQRLEAVLYYAQNDAFPEWLNQLRSDGGARTH
jgi:hypothetical protein